MRKLQPIPLGFARSRCSKTNGAIKLAQSQGGKAVTLEQRLLYIAEDPFGLCDKNSVRKIALEVRKIEDRIKQLEEENDAMRADLLLWRQDKWRE
jgi:hypothetical protein